MKKNNGVEQEFGKSGTGNKKLDIRYQEICRKAAAEGIVLLKNENGVLPLRKDVCVSVFGRVQVDYFTVGYGSGGDVKAPYQVNLLNGLKNGGMIQINEKLAGIYEKWCKENPVVENAEWGCWPRYYEEMPLTKELLRDAKMNSDVALVVIGRAAGEDRDNILEEGGYYLTKQEIDMLEKISQTFEHVIVLINSGNLMDMSFFEQQGNKIEGILLAWQGGMESGNAAADVLSGRINPCGRLTDTIARKYEDYPGAEEFGGMDYNCYVEDIFPGYRYFETFEKNSVLYPFGYGLSYTQFTKRVLHVERQRKGLTFTVEVMNTGEYAGKEVIQLYCECPRGRLGKPRVQLAGFAKTKLLEPLDTQYIKLRFLWADIASYDEEGITGHPSAFVLEKGEYHFFLGENVRERNRIYVCSLPELEVLKQAEPVMTIKQDHIFTHMAEKYDENGKSEKIWLNSFIQRENRKERILQEMPEGIEIVGDRGYKLSQVESEEVSMNEFIAQLSIQELEVLSRGDIQMNSSFGPFGNAGAFGGLTDSLREKGIAPIITTDGPSGIRLQHHTALLPCGTNLACSWDVKLIEELTGFLGREMQERGTDILLAPGINIHRNPLCGRNFEYFSEDPVISGCMAAAFVRGIQREGKAACPKHFACNNQETNRCLNDTRITERALREIYLRAFEICVRESDPLAIMTSYNKINGVWSHYNYDLCTTVLRKEWGYQGVVMTDWWMESDADPDFENIWDSAYRIRAQVDVLMPGGRKSEKERADDSLLDSFQKNGISLGEMQRTAKNVLNLRIKLDQKEQSK